MSVLAITEQRDGNFRKITYEVLSEGRKLADGLGSELTALVVGAGVEGIASDLGKFGADTIMVAEHDNLGEYLTDVYTNVVAEIVKKVDPQVISIGASSQGIDLAARLSARLDAGLAMDCVAIRVDGENVIATRPLYGGKVQAEIAISGKPQIIATRPNAMSIQETAKAGTIEKTDVDPGDSQLQFVEKTLETGKVE